MRTEEVEIMNSKIETYNFPLDCPSPFDVHFDGNYFVYANKFSNLGKSISEFSFDTFVKYIPMGYKTIIINQREVLIQNGRLIKEWNLPEYAVNEQREDYILYSEKELKQFVTDWDRFVISNIIRNPMATSADLKSSIWIDKQKCMNYGKEFSRIYNCKILLSKVIKSISWH